MLLLVVVEARCTRSGPPPPPPGETTLRIGFQEIGSDALNGVRQLVQILSTEGLARNGEDGRLAPALAERWTVARDGMSMRLQLRNNVKFHNGAPVNATAVVKALKKVLPQYMGPAISDIVQIEAIGDGQIGIGFRRPSPFVLEALEAPIQETGPSGVIGTGPYVPVGPTAPNEMRANADYYLGRPAIDRIAVSLYPNVRSAWADLLRERIDMLYEVGVDALDSLTSANRVSVFTYVRHYQYVLVFNRSSNSLRSAEVRRALNKAVDRNALVSDAFSGRAVRSSSLIWPQHWAFTDRPSFEFAPKGAAATLSQHPKLRFKCLVRSDLELAGLVVKRQLESVGVEMSLEEASLSRIVEELSKDDFDAVLIDVISGPNLFRPYQLWHSRGSANPGGFGSASMDAALDRVRYATNDDEYRRAVEGLQRTTVEDPPAIFLAWSERARAVNRRFVVPAEPGRDVLTTLRLWKPADAEERASRN